MTEKKKPRALSDKRVDKIARLAHRVGMAIPEAFGEALPRPWEATTEESREIAKQGVRLVVANPHITAEMIHRAWVSLKAENGWTFGEEKDEENKTHPYMVEFSKLPQRQKLKDCIFVESIKAALEVV